MKLSLLFLIIASTLFASTDLALASGKSELTKAVEFDSVPRYLRTNSTIEQVDEERKNPVKLDVESVRAAFEQVASNLPDFEYHNVKAIMEQHVKTSLQMRKSQEIRNVLAVLSEREFLLQLRRQFSIRFSTYLDIAIYLVLLDYVNSKFMEVAKHIHTAMVAEPKDTRFTQDMRNVVPGVEKAQFLLWSTIVGDLKQVKSSLIGYEGDTKWKHEAGKRYQNFYAHEANRRIPGVEEASTSKS